MAECATGVDQPLTQRGQLNNNQTDLAARLDSPKSNSREDYSDMTDQLFIPLDEIVPSSFVEK
ncbi:unnamed protein product [Toxocara canis]|uniref:Uncharacterized protein n=1 Tax=Toxocara canis TaxID=6265 RepID=A0A3P7GP37_TOXCA|nr:unnamed protein product [Toxocara canis]